MLAALQFHLQIWRTPTHGSKAVKRNTLQECPLWAWREALHDIDRGAWADMVADQAVEQAMREAERAQSQTPSGADPIIQSGRTGSVVVAQTDAACRSLPKIIQRMEAVEAFASGRSNDARAMMPPSPPECVTVSAGTRVTRTGRRTKHPMGGSDLWFVEISHRGDTRWIMASMLRE